FDFQFLDVCYWFRLSVLGRLLLVSTFGSWTFQLSVLGVKYIDFGYQFLGI
ncbi:hypothetical protein RhiirA1_459019, partial [Rhizophagus irregularis]